LFPDCLFNGVDSILAVNENRFVFEEIPLESFPQNSLPEEILHVWRSDVYLVRHYRYKGVERLSIDYSIQELNGSIDNISWQTLQDIKSMIGFGHRTAVELFPSDENVITGIAMRHLWLIDERSAEDFSLLDSF